MKCIIAQKEHTGASGKNAQKLNGQKLLLAKNYLEQKLESQGYRGRVKYDSTNKGQVQFQTVQGTIAVLREGQLCIFEIPVKKFRGSLPVEFESVKMDSINTEQATCCKKCHIWKKQADISRCVCGGYLVPRKRFSTGTIESWDVEYLEIQFARKDIRNAVKTERKMAHKPKQYVSSGITPKIAGKSSVQYSDVHNTETLLIPVGEDIREVIVRPATSCSMIFACTIKKGKTQISDVQKMALLEKYNINQADDTPDRIFASEAKRFIANTAPAISCMLIDSWENPHQRASKISRRKANSSEKKRDKNAVDLLRNYKQNLTNYSQ